VQDVQRWGTLATWELSRLALSWLGCGQGRYAPDPRHERLAFVEACREGDYSTVQMKTMCGADVNAVDNAECEFLTGWVCWKTRRW
jgi:hypothetical protein